MREPLEYHQLHRLGRTGAWRPLVGAPLLFLATFAVVPYALSRFFELDLDNVTPSTLVFVNLVLASAIPTAILVNLALHGLGPGWLMSVAHRIRWRFLLGCLGLSVVALLATVVVSTLMPQSGEGGAELTGEVNSFTSTTRDFLLVVLILTPLQAAGEEFVFRGYFMQALGGLFGSRVVAVVLSSVLFALAHGFGQDLPIFFDRLAFGLLAGALVILTGGLEAGIAMHVLNNFLAFGLALAFTDMTSALNPTDGTWWSLPGTITRSLVYLVLATWLARRMGLATSVAADDPRTIPTTP